jgi:hypothetical protein
MDDLLDTCDPAAQRGVQPTGLQVTCQQRQQLLRASRGVSRQRDCLEALSMHKLGDALGVRAMSLYKHVPGGLIRTALLVCGDCDMTSQFRIGVDLMIRGLDAYLDTLRTPTAAVPD